MFYFLWIGLACAEQLSWLPDAWFYPGGRMVIQDRVWYWENGQQIGYVGNEGAILYRPNGEFFMFAPYFNRPQLDDVNWILENLKRWLHLPVEEPTFGSHWIRGKRPKRVL